MRKLGIQRNNMNTTIETLRELGKNNKENTVYLPTEIVDIIEGNKIEKSWKEIDVSQVLDYIASMMEE